MLINLRKPNVGNLLFLSCVLILSALFTVATANAGVVSAHFSSVSGNSQNGEYTYPYYLTLDGGNIIPMMCDDFYHGSGVGDTWLGNVTMLSSDNLSDTRFADYDRYLEAAFLLRQIKTKNAAEWGNINWAVWQIFNPQLNPGSGPSGTLGPEYWYNLAETTDLSLVDVTDVAILTPLDAHSMTGDQEFLFLTPEPAALLLVGSGLIGVWSQRKRFV
jgi:hypothetical protein